MTRGCSTQPVGSGYSYSSAGGAPVTTEVQMADQVYEFLQRFLTAHSKYQPLRFFIFGEVCAWP